MMIVPTYVGPSTIEGVGVFAAEAVPAGAPIWKLDDRLDLLMTSEEVARLPDLQRSFFERYGYPHMSHEGSLKLSQLSSRLK